MQTEPDRLHELSEFIARPDDGPIQESHFTDWFAVAFVFVNARGWPLAAAEW